MTGRDSRMPNYTTLYVHIYTFVVYQNQSLLGFEWALGVEIKLSESI